MDRTIETIRAYYDGSMWVAEINGKAVAKTDGTIKQLFGVLRMMGYEV